MARPATALRLAPPYAAALAITAAGMLVYSNTYRVPFLFDDQPAIEGNATIRQLWPITVPLSPPCDGSPVTGRPLLNLSFAINYAISRNEVWSYHVANLAIHLVAALLLFGVVRRTLTLPTMRDRWGAASVPLALAIALLWTIHPLQTESVTYLSQRAESLVGMFYFLTLYCFIRGATSAGAGYWYGGAVPACLLGMASKETMVSAPLIVLLFDRAFCAGSFREALRRRYGLYLGLACTWGLLGWLVVSAGGRGGTAGFGRGISSWSYLATQFGAIVHYLKLSLWPHPLLLDYGTVTVRTLPEIVPWAAVVTLLGTATLLALWRSPKIGFLGAWFFAILAPTSSVIPVATQTVAEHRMYLPLAAIVAAVVALVSVAGRRLGQREAISRSALHAAGGCLVIAAGVVFGTLTYERNEDYQNALSIWQDAVAKAPGNARAQLNLGTALDKCGLQAEAIERYQEAIRIQPNYADAYYSLGLLFSASGLTADAIQRFRQALRVDPNHADAHNNLGLALARSGQDVDALEHFRQAVRLKPDYAEAHNNLANVLEGSGQTAEALREWREAVRIDPGFAGAHFNLGACYARLGRRSEAIRELEQSLRLAEAEGEDSLAQTALAEIRRLQQDKP